ncbi:hypothetical protein GGD64_007734 [Bradyrhizobium sp. CIR3A]|nr:hypothetical protein [Bradyrhizobium sp. CIR3A]
MADHTVDLDKHRGMAAQKATELHRALAEAENNVRALREREADLENRLLTVAAASWPEAAAKARYLLNLYAASLPAEETRHRALVAALLDDFVRLSGEDRDEESRLHSRPVPCPEEAGSGRRLRR